MASLLYVSISFSGLFQLVLLGGLSVFFPKQPDEVTQVGHSHSLGGFTHRHVLPQTAGGFFYAQVI